MLIRRPPGLGRAAGGLVAAGAVLAATALASPAATERVASEGGTFRIAHPASPAFEGIDPAVYLGHSTSQILRPACGALLNFPNARLPVGLRLAPELAEAFPAVSRDGRTYTFRIRKDARFSNGAPVLARDVAHSLVRVLTPALRSPFASTLADIVGSQAVLDGKATRLSGATARGRTLTLRVRQPAGDFPFRASVCVVPASVGFDPEGAKAPLPSPAPYYVSQYVPDSRLVLERNRFYRGRRPHHVNRFVVALGTDTSSIVEQIERGTVEWGWIGGASWTPFLEELTRRYGVNRSQFFALPGGGFLRMFALNTSRPLFRNNVRLRQAINFAVDRRALIREFGPAHGTPTDQYLPPVFPAHRAERIYPLEGPDIREARRLAAGRTRSGKAVLYTCSNPLCIAQSQILRRNLRAIDLELEVVEYPVPLIFEKLATDGEPFDIGWIGWGMSGPEALGGIFDGRVLGQAGHQNFSYFDSPTYNRLIDEANGLPLGRPRERAWGDLDVRLSRDAAPGVPYGVTNALTFVSAKVGCIVLNPFLDLTAVCLK